MAATEYSRDLEVLGLSNKKQIVEQSWLFKTTFISCQWHLTVPRLLLFKVFFPWPLSGKEFLNWNIQDLSLWIFFKGHVRYDNNLPGFHSKTSWILQIWKKLLFVRSWLKYTSIMLSGKVKAGTFLLILCVTAASQQISLHASLSHIWIFYDTYILLCGHRV